MESSAPPRGLRLVALAGPGIALAATGVGAGDLVAAAAAGSRHGIAIGWAVVAGALVKLALSEGLARWQLATGTTLLEGWHDRLGRWASLYALVYLVAWSFIVGAALTTACGLGAHALFPALSVPAWGAIHAGLAALFVLFGSYERFEGVMKLLIGAMFACLLVAAARVDAPLAASARFVTDAGVPEGSGPLVLGVVGGVGGSLTLLSYGYWIRAKGWRGAAWLPAVRVDLTIAYGMTALFGLVIVLLAGEVLHPAGRVVEGREGVLVMATMLGETLGPWGELVFKAGFWAAVATSMLGVWQGVPSLFADLLALLRRAPAAERERATSPRSLPYRLFVLWLAGPPCLLLFFERPFALIVLYAIVGALFMPFLAATLLYMNGRRAWVGELAHGWFARGGLVAALALFAALAGRELFALLFG